MTVQYTYDISSILSEVNLNDVNMNVNMNNTDNKVNINGDEIKEIKEKIDRRDKEYGELKIRIEENIKNLKDSIYQMFEVSYKNKSELERMIGMVNKLNTDFLKIIQDIDEYKKITNERIEKLFKLVMMTTEKLNIKF